MSSQWYRRLEDQIIGTIDKKNKYKQLQNGVTHAKKSNKQGNKSQRKKR